MSDKNNSENNKQSNSKLSSDQQIKEALQNPVAATIFIAPDDLRRRRFRSALESKINPNYTCLIKADQATERDLLKIEREITNFSILNTKQLFIIDNFDKLAPDLQIKFAEILLKLKKQTNTNLVYLLCLAEKPLAKSHPVTNQQSACIIQLEQLQTVEIRRWVEKELQRCKVTIMEHSLIDKLIEISEADLNLISQRIEIISLYCDGQPLNKESFEKLFQSSGNANEFNLIELLANGNYKGAEKLLTQILRNEKNNFMLLGLLARSFQQCLQIKFAESAGENQANIRQRLKLSPWLFNKAYNIAKLYTCNKLELCIKELILADSKLKNRSLGAEEIFSSLLYRTANLASVKSIS